MKHYYILGGSILQKLEPTIDKTNRNVKEDKMNPREAVANAGVTRLQPILLTSLTTMAGVFPLTFADELETGGLDMLLILQDPIDAFDGGKKNGSQRTTISAGVHQVERGFFYFI